MLLIQLIGVLGGFFVPYYNYKDPATSQEDKVRRRLSLRCCWGRIDGRVDADGQPSSRGQWAALHQLANVTFAFKLMHSLQVPPAGVAAQGAFPLFVGLFQELESVVG